MSNHCGIVGLPGAFCTCVSGNMVGRDFSIFPRAKWLAASDACMHVERHEKYGFNMIQQPCKPLCRRRRSQCRSEEKGSAVKRGGCSMFVGSLTRCGRIN